MQFESFANANKEIQNDCISTSTFPTSLSLAPLQTYLDFLWLEDVAKDMISYIQHVLSFGSDELGESVARASGVDVAVSQGTGVTTDAYGSRYL